MIIETIETAILTISEWLIPQSPPIIILTCIRMLYIENLFLAFYLDFQLLFCRKTGQIL